MQKTLLSILFICGFGFSSIAQISSEALRSYQSTSNEYYWKNRTPVTGYWQQDVHYKIDAVISDAEESVTGKEHLVYWNNSPDALDRVYFHLYQNAFTPESYMSDMRKNDHVKSTYGDHEAKGEGTVISSFKVNGKDVSYTLNNTILMVKLDQPLLPGTGITFDIGFTTYWDQDDKGNIRRRMKTFRHGGVDDREFIQFDGVHWYPRISVYDRKFGWTTDQHLGKEFYGDYGVYDVSLNFPVRYVVEATGELQNEAEMYPGDLRQRLDISNYKTTRSEYTNPIPDDGTTKTWRYKAINVHDFAFVADPTFRIGEVVWNGVRCIALAQEEHAHRWQPSAQFVADVVRTYSEEIGMFGYPKMIAADARDGMEYPMLTLDGGNFPGHKGLLAHEVGHNWFFGMVGNNETYRASLDEGFTTYLTSLALRKLGNVKGRPNATDDFKVYHGYMSHATTSNTASLNTHSDHFNSAQRHGGGYGQVYYKTATMLYNLQYVLGDELFDAAFKNYFDQWKFCHPYWADFRNSIIQYTHVDLNWYFDEWLENNSVIDYKVSGVKSLGEDTYSIKFKRLGMTMPIDFTVVDSDGKRHKYHIPNTDFKKKTNAKTLEQWTGWGLIKPTYSAKVKIPGGIKDVVIDVSGRMADVNRLNNSKKTPIHWSFDRLNASPSSFRSYHATYRPDLWYNAIDGIKAGVKLKGNYYQSRHVFEFGAWYNTGVGTTSDFESVKGDVVSYQLDYKTKLKGQNNLVLNSRYIDGYVYNRLAMNRQTGKAILTVAATGNKRTKPVYLIIPEFGNGKDMVETRMSLAYVRPFRQFNGTGEVRLTTSASALFSEYSYSSAGIEIKHHRRVGKLVLRSRFFAGILEGISIAPESMIQMSGASTAEMMNNRYTRSVGTIALNTQGFNREGNHFQTGGGLNLRGYSGYAATNIVDGDTFNIYGGSRGGALNAELDFGNAVKIRAGKLNRILDIDPYLFADMGMLGNTENQWSGLRIDAGFGSMVGIKFPGLSGTKPLNLRFDFPVFLNRIPREQSDYFAFRYIIGINRAF
jgi:Peptidase family M1 domain